MTHTFQADGGKALYNLDKLAKNWCQSGIMNIDEQTSVSNQLKHIKLLVSPVVITF